MNEPYLREIAETLSTRRKAKSKQQPVTFATLGHHLAGTWAAAVQIEMELAVDDPRAIRFAVAKLAARVLVALHDLGVPWVLRTPHHRTGRYATGADLTAGLRRRLSDVWRYLLTAPERDAVIALELVLKEAFELASTLEFDLLNELAVSEHYVYSV